MKLGQLMTLMETGGCRPSAVPVPTATGYGWRDADQEPEGSATKLAQRAFRSTFTSNTEWPSAWRSETLTGLEIVIHAEQRRCSEINVLRAFHAPRR